MRAERVIALSARIIHYKSLMKFANEEKSVPVYLSLSRDTVVLIITRCTYGWMHNRGRLHAHTYFLLYFCTLTLYISSSFSVRKSKSRLILSEVLSIVRIHMGKGSKSSKKKRRKYKKFRNMKEMSFNFFLSSNNHGKIATK